MPLSLIHIIYTIELQTGYFQRPRELFRIPSLIISVSIPSILPSMLHWKKSVRNKNIFANVWRCSESVGILCERALTGLQLHILFSWTPVGVTRKSLMTTSDAGKNVNQTGGCKLGMRHKFGIVSVKVFFRDLSRIKVADVLISILIPFKLDKSVVPICVFLYW